MQYKKTTAILLAVLAAAFYAVNVPVSKLLLKEISPTFLASLLYFGAAIVIGNEGSGMSRLVAESCDLKVSIPLKGHISSLNASTAAAVLLYEAVRQRG